MSKFSMMAFAAAAMALLGAATQVGAAPAPVSFAAAVTYPTGGTGGTGWHETGLVTADFNHDGHDDLVASDFFVLGSPRLMLGNGDGSFQPGVAITDTSILVGTLGVGDLNGDGNMDLIGTNTWSVIALLGDGHGHFTRSSQQFVFQSGQEDAVLLDANVDGKLDLAVVTRYGFVTLLGNGDGTFQSPKTTFVAGIFPSAIDVAKFDYDSKPDILLIDAAGGQAIKFQGNGDGTFKRTGTGVTGIILGTGLAADFNHDGIDDVVALPEFNVVANAAVWISDARGGFTSVVPKYYDGGLAPVSGEVADLNHDGNADIISCDTGGSQMVVLLGDGSGNFFPGGKFPIGSIAAQTPVVADFDHDGDIDIGSVGVKLTGGQSMLGVLLNTTL